jgi:hypothetical protein
MPCLTTFSPKSKSMSTWLILSCLYKTVRAIWDIATFVLSIESRQFIRKTPFWVASTSPEEMSWMNWPNFPMLSLS